MSTSPDPRPAPGDLERPLLFGSVALISLVAFETLAVTTAMPTVAARLDGLHLYAVAFGVSLAAQLFTTPLAGHLADRHGPRRPLVAGLALFLTGLTVCGLAPTMAAFVLGRLVHGLGAGFLVVPLYVLVGALVPAARRPAFFAAFTAAWVVPSMVGPPVAGLLVEHTTWRWVFLGVAPLILAAALLLVPVLRRVPARAPQERPDAAQRRATRLLLASALGAGVASALLQTLSAGSGPSSPRLPPLATAALAVAALALVAVCLPRLLPRGSVRLAPGLPSVVAGRALLNGGFIGIDVFLPLMLQQVHGWRPAAAGLVLTVGSVTWAIGSAVQGRVAGERARRAMVVGGPLVLLTGMALVALSVVSSPIWALLGWGLAGLGIGAAFPALSVLALALTPPERHGSMSSSLQIADTLGAALSLALVGALVTGLAGAGHLAHLAGVVVCASLAALAGLAGSRTTPSTP